MPLKELEAAMKKQPKFIRTVRHNSIQYYNPSYGDKFEEYKVIGTAKLKERAKLVRECKEFAEKFNLLNDLELKRRNKVSHKKICITGKYICQIYNS